MDELLEAFNKPMSSITLDLSDRRNIVELRETLGTWTSLVTLNLRGCSNLQKLPEALGNLTSLVTLNLECCWRLRELPETFGNLTSLVTLNLEWCWRLRELPETFGNLTSLVTLNLGYCKNLKQLSNTLANLTSLGTMYLNGWVLMLPEVLFTWTSLRTLNLEYCFHDTLPEALGKLTSLTTLNLRGCNRLETLPKALGTLMSLHALNLTKCWNLRILPDELGTLTSLVLLNLEDCVNLQNLPEPLSLTSLMTLNLSGCTKLTELPNTLANSTSLDTLHFNNRWSLEKMPKVLFTLTSLVTLSLTGCMKLRKLPKALGKLESLITLNLSGCHKLEELPKTLGKLMSLATLNLSGCQSLKKLPDTLDRMTSLVRMDLSGCINVEELPTTMSKLISLVTLNLSGCQGLKKLPETMGNLTSLVHLDLEGCCNLKRLPRGLMKLIALRKIVCGIRGQQGHDFLVTTVVGEIVDDSMRLCFEDEKSMSRMVGVGLEYALVIVSPEYEILVEEISIEEWEGIVSSNEKGIERLTVRISDYANSLALGVSDQPLDPIRIAKLFGVGIEGPGKCTNLDKKPCVSWSIVMELVKTMFRTRFQSHVKSNIDSKSNDGKVEGRAHGAEIWDLKAENEVGLNGFEVPSSWWSTKWWQNIAVDDTQVNNCFDLNMESCSGRIGRQHAGDDNVQHGKGPSSSNKDSRPDPKSLDKTYSDGKRISEGQQGGDNNDEDDDHNNAERTCQDGSKLKSCVDEEDDIISTVHVLVKPKYAFWHPTDARKNQMPVNIDPALEFWFHKSTSSREIKVQTSVRFDLGDHGPTPRYSKQSCRSFGWYHDDIQVSLQSTKCDSSTLKHANMILQPSTSGKISFREISGSVSNPSHMSGNVSVRGGHSSFMAKGRFGWDKNMSPTQTKQFEQALEMPTEQSLSGFTFMDISCGGAQPRLAYRLKHPHLIPDQVWNTESCYHLLVQCGICSTITHAMEGTWQDLDTSEISPYSLAAKRWLYKRREKTTSSMDKETDDEILEYEHEHEVKLLVNHAMTHMNQFQKLTPVLREPMEDGLINIEDGFYGNVRYDKLCQEQVAKST